MMNRCHDLTLGYRPAGADSQDDLWPQIQQKVLGGHGSGLFWYLLDAPCLP